MDTNLLCANKTALMHNRGIILSAEGMVAAAVAASENKH